MVHSATIRNASTDPLPGGQLVLPERRLPMANDSGYPLRDAKLSDAEYG
jgi:hypothetical protein